MKQLLLLKVFVFLGTQISKKAISNDESHQVNITGTQMKKKYFQQVLSRECSKWMYEENQGHPLRKRLGYTVQKDTVRTGDII